MNALTRIEGGQKSLALAIPQDQTFEQWVAMGRDLFEGQRVINWWIGDWWAAGSHRYGERAAAAAQGVFGLEYKSLSMYGSICRAFEPSRRLEHLTFSHHAEVAALPPSEADTLLAAAQNERLSTRELRVEAMKRKVALGLFVPREDDDPDHTELLDIARRWNRAKRSVRETFLELANESGLDEIDP